jgi:hypothetical protein
VDKYVETKKTFPYSDSDTSPLPGEIHVLCDEQGRPRMVNFLCPCGCGRDCPTPVSVDAKSEHHWLLSQGINGPTLSPLIRYLDGCKAHFNITDGAVQFHGDSGQ